MPKGCGQCSTLLYTKCGSFQTRVGPELQYPRMVSLPREKTSVSQVTHGIAPRARRDALVSLLKSERGVKARARRSQDRTLKKTFTTDTFRTASFSCFYEGTRRSRSGWRSSTNRSPKNRFEPPPKNQEYLPYLTCGEYCSSARFLKFDC